MMKDELFKPQAMIIVQTNILQDQIQRILKFFQEFGENKKSEKLKFKIGRMDKEKHEHGDIIVTMPKSFMNRYTRGNLSFDNCKFIAIDEVDDIFEQEKETLAEILKIAEKNRPNVITCSATMKKEFMEFYEANAKDCMKFNINEMLQKELGERITLEGVKNYYHVATAKEDMHKFVISTLFKHLYEKVDKKPQVFIFFDSVDEIKEFHDYFKARVPHSSSRLPISPPKSMSTSRTSPSASSPPRSMRTTRRWR
jgi:superfamily II DNA/RNA helicase